MPIEDYSPEALAEIVDGCNGGVSWVYDKILKRDVPFLYCCDCHDLAYEEGGSRKDRKLADKRFRICIQETGRPIRAWIFWVFVRLFGGKYWNWIK